MSSRFSDKDIMRDMFSGERPHSNSLRTPIHRVYSTTNFVKSVTITERGGIISSTSNVIIRVSKTIGCIKLSSLHTFGNDAAIRGMQCNVICKSLVYTFDNINFTAIRPVIEICSPESRPCPTYAVVIVRYVLEWEFTLLGDERNRR